jgi:hypothetical protein
MFCMNINKPSSSLMFVPYIISRSRNNQHYAQICTTALFYILVPIRFGSSLPSSESFWTRLSYMKIQIDLVVYHIMLVKCPVCRSIVVQSIVLLSLGSTTDLYFHVTQTDPEAP